MNLGIRQQGEDHPWEGHFRKQSLKKQSPALLPGEPLRDPGHPKMTREEDEIGRFAKGRQVSSGPETLQKPLGWFPSGRGSWAPPYVPPLSTGPVSCSLCLSSQGTLGLPCAGWCRTATGCSLVLT